MKISPSRQAAFEILFKIESEKAYSSALLDTYEANLPPENRALCHEITLGVLRNQTFLDSLIEQFSGKSIAKLDLEILLILRLGLYQLRFLDNIPEHAIVNETVNMVQAVRKKSASGFVNAVLRRNLRERFFNPIKRISDKTERIALETSHPKWLIEKWTQQFGADEAENICFANNGTPKTTFRLTRNANADISQILFKSNLIFQKGELAKSCYVADKSNQTLRDFAKAGEVYLQDEASQYVAQVVDLQANESFLDVCAAPGSKFSQISNSASQNLLIAGDKHLHRLKTLRETCAKLGEKNANAVAYDAEKSLPFADQTFDCILIDAPCSGTGTIRHNPEIRWNLKPEDFAELAAKQTRILANAANLVKPNGRLIYSTCSMETEENEEVIANFLAANNDFKQTFTRRTFPHIEKCDGFFITVLVKN